MLIGFRRQQLVEAGEALRARGVVRLQTNARSCSWCDPASSQNIQCNVHAHRAGMKQVQRPDVERAACEVGATRGRGHDGISAKAGLEFRYTLHNRDAAKLRPVSSQLPIADQLYPPLPQDVLRLR